MKKLLLLSCILIITGCSKVAHQDINKWMTEKTKTEKRKIPALPVAKSFIPIMFDSQLNPFKERQLLAKNLENSKYAPNPDRRKEPLESYSLSQLKMKGFLINNKIPYAMILAPDGTINYVSKNNYIGNNYGQIVSISETEIILDERFKEGENGWISKKTTVLLDENI